MCQIRLFQSKVSLTRKNLLSVVTCRQKTIASLDVFQKGQGLLARRQTLLGVRLAAPPANDCGAAASTLQNAQDRHFAERKTDEAEAFA